jgi:hypothetical protein
MQPGRSISPDASALEHLSHVVRKICDLWGKEEFDNYVNSLIFDSRDGKRQGLPYDAVEDLLFLVELAIAKRALVASELTGMPFKQAFRQFLEKAHKFAPSEPGETDNPWLNPLDRQEGGRIERTERIGRTDHGPTPVPAPPVKRGPTHKKKSWWRRLVG